MSDTDIWENVKNSLFWQAGTLSWSRSLKKWVSIAAGTQKLYSTAYDSVCLIDQDYKYRSDEADLTHLQNPVLRPSFKQCVMNYLPPKEQQFMLGAFARARAAWLEYCLPSYYLSAVLISAPGTFFVPHIHAWRKNLSFTYVVASNHTPQKGSTLLIDPGLSKNTTEDNAYNIRLDHPGQSEFFMLLDTSMYHWTHAEIGRAHV